MAVRLDAGRFFQSLQWLGQELGITGKDLVPFWGSSVAVRLNADSLFQFVAHRQGTRPGVGSDLHAPMVAWTLVAGTL